MAPTSKDGSRRGNCPLFGEEAVTRREWKGALQRRARRRLEGKFGASSRGNTDSRGVYGGCCS